MTKIPLTDKPKRKKLINEIFFLRAIACICIVLLHSLASAQRSTIDLNGTVDMIVNSVRVILTFGTPTFIFISMLLISYSYPNGLPDNFLQKRVKLILIPYISMAIFYGVLNSKSLDQVFPAVTNNLLGGFHGYFVLIIFQFYLLAYFFHNFLSKSNPRVVILSALAINLGYLAVFNFISPPIDNDFINYIWKRGHYIFFVGWVLYFAVAYYSGKHYTYFLKTLNTHRSLIILSTIIIGIITIILANLEIIPLSSKNVMMVFFTICMIGSLYLIALKIKVIPSILMTISRYSYSIYLLHMFFIGITYKIMNIIGIDLELLNTIPYFFGSIIGSILMTYIFNKIKFGHYIVGTISKIGR